MDLTNFNIKLPKLRVCCSCIPLRTGLLAFGYLYLVYNAVLLALIFRYSAMIIFYSFNFHKDSPELREAHINIMFIPALLLILILYCSLIVGAGHFNSVNLLNALFIIGILLCIQQIPYSVYVICRLAAHPTDSVEFIMYIVAVILEPLPQVYGVVLIRWFILELREEKYSVKNTNLNKDRVVEMDRDTGDPLIV